MRVLNILIPRLSIARTINFAIDPDDHKAAEAEQLSTPSPVARLRENAEAFRCPP
jgi:hypothetical protein